MGKAAEQAQKNMNSLGKNRPRLDADSNPLLKKLNEAESRTKKLNNSKASVLLNIKDSGAWEKLAKVKSGLVSLTKGAWTAVITVKDAALAPIRKLKSELFSLKNLARVVVGGMVANKVVKQPVQMYANYEDLVTQFGVLLGSQDAAKQRMADLVKFAGQTPFTRDEIFQASRVLQTYTQGALATPDAVGGLRMIGDVAAGTGQSYERVANYFGQLYNEVSRGGKSMGEPLMLLREIGALSAESEQKIQKIATGSGTIEQKWAKIAQEFSRTDGMMEAMSNQMNNLMLGVKSFIKNNLWMKLGEGISESLKPFLADFRTWRSENSELISGWADRIREFAKVTSGKALDAVRGLAKRADALFRSDEFNGASLSEKIRMAWTTIFSDPISEWWANGGQEKTAAAAGRIGNAIGGMLGGAILGVLGFTTLATDIGTDGGSVAKSFVDGFLAGFDADAIKNAIKDALTNGWNTFKEASIGGKIVSGGIAAGLLGKYISPFLPLLKLGGGLLSKGGGFLKGLVGKLLSKTPLGKLFGGGGFLKGLVGKLLSKTPLGKLFGGGAGALGQAVGTMTVSAGAVFVNGTIFGGGGGGGMGPLALPAAGGGTAAAAEAAAAEAAATEVAAAAGTAAGGSILSTVGNILGKAGLIGTGIFAAGTAIKGGQEAYRGQKLYNAGDITGGGTMMGKGYGKMGMVGGGAAIGALGGPLGMLAGAGIGAGAGWLFGDVMDESEKLAEHAKQTHHYIKGTVGEAKNLGRAFEETPLVADDNALLKLKNRLELLKYAARMGEYSDIYKPPGYQGPRTSGRQFEESPGGNLESNYVRPDKPYKPSSKRTFESTPSDSVSGVKTVSEQVRIKAHYLVEQANDPVKTVQLSIPDTVSKATSVAVNATSHIFGLGDVGAKIRSAVPSSVSANTTVRVNCSAILSGLGGIAQQARNLVQGYARRGYRGGIFGGGYSDGGVVRGGARLIKVAEEGSPEMVIPLSSQRRERGLQLWRQAGHMMGVPGYARGGLVGRDEALRAYANAYGEAPGSPGETRVEVGGVTVHMSIQASSEGSVADAVRAQQAEITDAVAGAIVKSLQVVFENTPTKGGAVA